MSNPKTDKINKKYVHIKTTSSIPKKLVILSIKFIFKKKTFFLYFHLDVNFHFGTVALITQKR
jgi:hypothetical protein